MKRKKHRKVYVLFSFFIFLLGTICLLSFADRKLSPALQEISHIQCKTTANQIIDAASEKVITEMNMASAPLFLIQENGYAANTTLINRLCQELSMNITEQLNRLPSEKIEVPFGALTGFQFPADKGPHIPFTLLPMGSAKVDYSSAFQSVGINQINYRIWLNVTINLKIVNPFYQETITMTRKLVLADVVFSGIVPEQYFQMTLPDEYLLTE